jgi:hypothetical protein
MRRGLWHQDIFLIDVDSGPATLACMEDLVSMHAGRIIALAHTPVSSRTRR